MKDNQDSFTHDSFIVNSKSVLSLSESALYRIVEQDPNNSIALNNLATHLSCQGNLSDAEVFFERALQVAPEDESIAYNLAVVLMKRFNFIKALDVLLKLKPPVEIEPNVNLQIGTCLLALHRYQEAVNYLLIASTGLPNSKEAHYNLFKAASHSHNQALAAKAKAAYLELSGMD